VRPRPSSTAAGSSSAMTRRSCSTKTTLPSVPSVYYGRQPIPQTWPLSSPNFPRAPGMVRGSPNRAGYYEEKEAARLIRSTHPWRCHLIGELIEPRVRQFASSKRGFRPGPRRRPTPQRPFLCAKRLMEDPDLPVVAGVPQTPITRRTSRPRGGCWKLGQAIRDAVERAIPRDARVGIVGFGPGPSAILGSSTRSSTAGVIEALRGKGTARPWQSLPAQKSS